MRTAHFPSLLTPVCALAALATFGAFATNEAQAATIPVTNFSFESPVVPTGQGYIGSPSLPGWNYVNASGTFNYVQVFDATLPAESGITDGNQYVGM